MEYKQVLAIELKNKERIKKVCPDANEQSGLYIMTREESGFKYCYVGQAKHLLTRLAQHLAGYQHIDLSLRKHGLYDNENKGGWKIRIMPFPLERLDIMEQQYIRLYANLGYQMRNKTIGGQGEGKQALGDGKSTKGYRDGLSQGYTNAQREVSKLFEKNLTYSINGTPNKNKEKAYQKFTDFISKEN